MKVVFSTNGQLRDALGEEELKLEFPTKVGLIDVAQEVASRVNTAVRRLLLDEQNNLQQGLMLVINDEMVFEGEETLQDGDHVSIFLPMAGG